MNYKQLFKQIKKKKSFLCIGLDPDITKMPVHFVQLGIRTMEIIFEFNKAIIDATHDIAVAYKPNLAFYECHGLEGIKAFEMTVRYIRNNYPEIFIIADAKRGDIGNTSKMYAKAFLETWNTDAVTVAPYMGKDSVSPFLEYKGKWVVLLALTSNEGAIDFQWYGAHDGGGYKNRDPLFWEVIQKSKTWANQDNMMYVIGATKAEYLEKIRTIIPNHFLLVPGVGAQGGSLEDVATYGMNESCGLIVNSSREIIYASEVNYALEAAKVARNKYQQPMEKLLRERKLI